MRHGKYQTKRKLSPVSWVLMGIALLGMTVGGVAAYLSTQSGAVTNTFTAETNPQPSVDAEQYAVNVGDPGYAVYVRAAVVVTWQDGDPTNPTDTQNVLAKVPVKGTDYEISYNTTDWFLHDGFWYCKTMVNSGGTTPALITSCEVKDANGDYHLNVEIVAQTIQALGTTDESVDENGDPIPTVPAVTDAWGVYVDANKNLSATASSENS